MFFTLVLLKALYTPVPGTDIEYGQGAIERLEVRHREFMPNTWLIEVDEPADEAEWQRRLNETVRNHAGSFEVCHATADEERQVANGEITLQK